MNLVLRPRRWIFDLIPAYSKALQGFCQRYVDRYNGDNNSDSSRNGEELLLRTELPKLRGGVVFDAGANVGNWAKYALQVESSIQLHCFEPSQATFRLLSENKWSSDVHLNNLGLGDAEGQLELNIVDSSSALNSLYARRGVEPARGKSKETISVTTVDAYCEQKGIDHIHFFKVDVEGHELAVFKGMSRMLRERRVQMIQFEYGGRNLDARVFLADIWEYLAPFGFEFHKLYPEGPKHILNYNQEQETFRYSNWLAVVSEADTGSIGPIKKELQR